MEVELGISQIIYFGARFIVHKYRQYAASTHKYHIANTSYGQVRGQQRKNLYQEHDNYFAFEGIPYAKPPLGELRFRSPQSPDPWQGVLDCTTFKAKPMQFNYLAKMAEGSEDCLYLNVYAKKLRTDKPLPVMVWIYGGGYQIGEASRDFYGPDYFMHRDVVFVAFNYRLGVFGFLCLDEADLKIPGNAGLKDQVLALKWIKENIHHFNGDPNNITVFGESAGGASTHFMMMIPQTKGLFHKAIIQSGSVLCPWSFTKQHDWGYKLACRLGYKGQENDRSVYEYLAKQSSKRLVVRDMSMMTDEDIMNNLLFIFGPVIEPYVMDDCVVDKPFKALLANAWGNEIPLIIGGNTHEGLLLYGTKYASKVDCLTDMVNLLPEDVQSVKNDKELPELALRLKEVYFNGKQPNTEDNLLQYLELLGDRSFWHAVFRTMRARTEYAQQVPTYCYLFDFDSEFFNHFRQIRCGSSMRGVCHADDMSYLFYNLAAVRLDRESKEYQCIQRMVGMWYNFALTSNPNCEEIKPVLWKPLADFETPIKCLTISDAIEFSEFRKYQKLRVWDEFYEEEDLI